MQAAERLFGSAKAQALVTLIAEAEAFATADELMHFRGASDAHGMHSFSVEIGPNWNATFVPVGEQYGRDAAGNVEWSSVRRLKLKLDDGRPGS